MRPFRPGWTRSGLMGVWGRSPAGIALGQSVFERDGGELASPGLFVNLGPWQFHLLVLQ
jgi:hypothetical protein